MPELPEVETVRRVLEERLAGRILTELRVEIPTFYRIPPRRSLDGLLGAQLERLRRRGKYLLMDFARGATLSLHLGMSGRLALGGAEPNGTARHCRFTMVFGGLHLRFNDPRRFGRVGCVLPELGPEPLSAEFEPGYLRRAFRGRRAPVKALLLDQAVVAGLGNIYATECLHRAGIRPGRAAGGLGQDELKRLAESARAVLQEGIALGGCTLDDEAFLDPLGRPGRFSDGVRVYGRKTGACGHALKSTRRRIAGRRSLYCPVCQR